MSYSWCITVDHFKDTLDLFGDEAGTYGPRTSKLKFEDIKNHPNAIPFRMFTDDKELVYEGLYVGENDGPEDQFGPLDDFGTPNFGCTYIEYKNDDGEWAQL